MGVDLKLLVVEYYSTNMAMARTVIEFGGNRDAHDRIAEKCKPFVRRELKLSSYLASIPDGEWKGENGWGKITEDCYGKPITYVYAGDLASAFTGPKLDGPRPPAIAYCAELPEDTLIALYWH